MTTLAAKLPVPPAAGPSSPRSGGPPSPRETRAARSSVTNDFPNAGSPASSETFPNGIRPSHNLRNGSRLTASIE